jgi:hypothetical protein
LFSLPGSLWDRIFGIASLGSHPWDRILGIATWYRNKDKGNASALPLFVLPFFAGCYFFFAATFFVAFFAAFFAAFLGAMTILPRTILDCNCSANVAIA